jgi:hypothetical protein
LRDNCFTNDRTNVWQQGNRDRLEYTYIGIERLERHYDDEGKPLPNWTATLVAYTFDDIDSLRNFPESAEITVTYKLSGRADVFEVETVVLRMNNCKPLRGWFGNLAMSFAGNKTEVPYKLLVSCEVEYLFDAQKLAERESRIASIKKTTAESATEKPKTFWENITG